jgi:hypothetical protein
VRAWILPAATALPPRLHEKVAALPPNLSRRAILLFFCFYSNTTVRCTGV